MTFSRSKLILLLFRKQSLSLGRNDVVQLKEAYKWITHPLFSEELGVPTDGKVSDNGSAMVTSTHSSTALVLDAWLTKSYVTQ